MRRVPAKTLAALLALGGLAPAQDSAPSRAGRIFTRPDFSAIGGADQIPRPPGAPGSARSKPDAPVRRAQADVVGPGGAPALPGPALPEAAPTPMIGGQSISLQAALYGALTGNPDLVTLRQGNPIAASAEAVEVARRFPTTLNPTLWMDYRPITLIPRETFGAGSPGGNGGNGGGTNRGPFYHFGNNYLYLSLRQPVELGHQTTHRYGIAKAAFDQQRWTVVAAELTALVQTYRLYQTAAYRREKYRIAKELADFNDRLLETLQRRTEANLVPQADAVLARVESRSSRQQVKAARQDYLTALADLRNQIGIPEAAGAVEPLGEFTLPAYIPPVDEQEMVRTALELRPEIRAAQAQIAGTQSAVRLAKGDRIPSPIIGPEYQIDEVGVQYIGLVYITPIPILNSGKPLVRQREAEARRACVALEQARQRVVSQVRAAVARWNGATDLVNETSGLTTDLARDVADLERLFELNQTDLTRLMQARQRLIQLENSRMDAVWAATQAQADLLLALGAPGLIQGMLNQASNAANAGSAAPPPSSNASPFRAPAGAPPSR